MDESRMNNERFQFRRRVLFTMSNDFWQTDYDLTEHEEYQDPEA